MSKWWHRLGHEVFWRIQPEGPVWALCLLLWRGHTFCIFRPDWVKRAVSKDVTPLPVKNGLFDA